MADNYDTLTRWNEWQRNAEQSGFSDQSLFIDDKRGKRFSKKMLAELTGISRSTLSDPNSEVHKALRS